MIKSKYIKRHNAHQHDKVIKQQTSALISMPGIRSSSDFLGTTLPVKGS